MTLKYDVALVDGARSRRVAAMPGEPLADVVRREGFSLDYDCGGRGVCKRCVVFVAAPGDSAFQPRLACQTRVERPGMRVDVSRLRKTTATSFEAIVAPAPSTLADAATTAEERVGALALAVDLGSTTIECALASLVSGRTLNVAARRNPQVAFGRDVISRIAAAARRENADAMRALALRAIGSMAEELAARIGAETSQIVDVVVAGNATMEFLLTGRDPSPLGVAPFEVGSRVFQTRRAADVPVLSSLAPRARLRVFPVFSAFVGGDILSGFEYLRRRGAFDDAGARLFFDVGTNGESLLAVDGRFYATSTAAGPAFEGAEISQGALAVPGAIRAIDYDAATSLWRPTTIGDVPATGVCGSGLVDALAGALDFGAVAPNGRLRAADAPELADPATRARLRGDRRDRAFLISSPSELAATGGVWIAQRDVRQAQLAICAMKTGLALLLATARLDAGALDAVLIAGSFGGALNVESARRVGIFPPEVPASRVRCVGNASLLGALDAATGRLDLEDAARDVELVENVDLAASPDFNDVFAACARFPEPPSQSLEP